MACLSIRKLDDSVYEQLRLRAAKHGVSIEEEVRQIISQVVNASDKISDVFRNYFEHDNGVNLEVPTQHNPMDFKE